MMTIRRGRILSLPQRTTGPDEMSRALNVLGGELRACCFDPLTGYHRDGSCHHAGDDAGTHLVCARVTPEFLAFSLSRGNDLVTPRPEARFRGLRPGDRWCLCVLRWLEAVEAGSAPPVILAATHERALDLVPFEILRRHALDASPSPEAP
jgi:hypothetical protein